LVTSLDLVELNPFLDDRGRTAILLVDLVARLMGRRSPPLIQSSTLSGGKFDQST
jgi:hypothetical protein